MNNHKIIIPNAGKSTYSRIQNEWNTQFVDTASNNVSIDLMPSLSQGGGSETGRLKLARNMFELSAERIYANPNLKYKYSFRTKTNGSMEIQIEDTGHIPEPGYEERKETYSFDFSDTNNLNQVARKFEVDLAIQQAIEDVLLGEV